MAETSKEKTMKKTLTDKEWNEMMWYKHYADESRSCPRIAMKHAKKFGDEEAIRKYGKLVPVFEDWFDHVMKFAGDFELEKRSDAQNSGKSKDSEFKRKVAEDLSKAFGEPFIGAPHSDGLARGDIATPDIDPFKHWIIECKLCMVFPYHKFIEADTFNPLEGWIEHLTDGLEYEHEYEHGYRPDNNPIPILAVNILGMNPFMLTPPYNFMVPSSIGYRDSQKRIWCVTDWNTFIKTKNCGWQNTAELAARRKRKTHQRVAEANKEGER